MSEIVVRCQDYATVCRKTASWQVFDARAAWFYCDEHVPEDPEVELIPFQRGIAGHKPLNLKELEGTVCTCLPCSSVWEATDD